MLRFYGRAPNQPEVIRITEHPRALRCVYALIASVFVTQYAAAQYTFPLTLAEAETLALNDEPGRG